MKISVVISAYNEEKNIRECLISVKDLVHEIVVVDNSSTDNTQKIAKEFTDKVYYQENNPKKIDYQKNFGFSKATGDYILSLDADERLTPDLIREIKAIKDPVDGYWIPRKNFIFGKWIKSEMWWPDYQLRLFKKGHGKYNNVVHKQLEVNGECKKLETPMTHINYVTVSQFISKLNSYTDIEAKEALESGYEFNPMDAIRFPLNDFLKTYFLQKGYREGLHGLVLSIFQAFYMGVVFAKLWEAKDFMEVSDNNFFGNVKREIRDSGNKIKYWFTTILIDESKNPIKKTILKTTRKFISKKIS